VASELSDLVALKRRFQESVRKLWVLDASQERIGFVAAACQSLESGNDPCRLFTSLVKHKAWRVRGKGGLPESSFDRARALILRAERPEGIRQAAHPDLAKPSNPQSLGVILEGARR
jgi:hypothetical protein